jgi:hypothetical protein
VKLALNRAAKESNLSREEIAHRAAGLAEEAGVNLCPGGGLGKSTLDKWLNLDCPGHAPSLLGLAALCQLLNDARPLAPVLEFLGAGMMNEEDRKFRDLGRAQFEMDQARQKLTKAKERLC